MKTKNKNEERFFFILFIIFIIIILLLLIFKKSRSSFLSSFLSNPLKQPEKKKVVFKGEEIARSIFEDIFKKEFPKVKPVWLINPKTKKKLELDGFCPTIRTSLGKGVAFEYNGSQHEHFNPKFHKTYQDFLNQKMRDNIKAQICREKGVFLVSIPYIFTSREEIERFIRSKLTFMKNKK